MTFKDAQIVVGRRKPIAKLLAFARPAAARVRASFPAVAQ
jgi:hypothetical protein